MKKLCFHHIPKTGGTSVINSLVMAGMKHQSITSDQYGYEIKIQDSINLISSHWFLHSTVITKAYHFTILRNPVEMFFSFYFYIKRYNRSFDHHWMIRDYCNLVHKKQSIEDYADSKIFYPFSTFHHYKMSVNHIDHIGTLENLQPTIDWFNSVGIPVKKIGHYHKGKISEYKKQFPDLYKKVETILQPEIEVWRKALKSR